MAILKIKQIRNTPSDELNKKLNDLRLELAKEYGGVKMGRPTKNTGKIRELRRAIARINTIQHERKLARAKSGEVKK